MSSNSIPSTSSQAEVLLLSQSSYLFVSKTLTLFMFFSISRSRFFLFFFFFGPEVALNCAGFIGLLIENLELSVISALVIVV